MSLDISSRQVVSRTAVYARGGMVAGKMAVAVDAGAGILAQGGNAIDAAVATAFAMGVAEPWMNGLGGGGFMLVWLAKERRAVTIEYPMVAPSGAREDMFEPRPASADGGNFGWHPVVEDANIVGYKAVAVPGTTAGLVHALAKYGTLPLETVIAPAIAIAETGILVDWHTTLRIATDLANLQRFPETARTYLVDGTYPPANTAHDGTSRIRFPKLAATLRKIAINGAAAIHDSPLTDAIVDHLASRGTPIMRDDFRSYTVQESPGITVDFFGHKIHLVGGGSGGTSVAQALKALSHFDLASLGHNTQASSHLLDAAFRQAFADRFAYLADPNAVDVPIDAMLDDAYAGRSALSIAMDHVQRPTAASPDQFGISHGLAPSLPDYTRDSSTTHLGVIDADGNGVSLTQTLLSLWGSRVMVPETGMLMNNGMMWFDPEPGHPNSIAPGKRPLANMAPMLVSRDDVLVASIGSSGGRKILNCNTQVLLNLVVHGMDMHAALEAPRLDTSTRDLKVSDRFAPKVIAALRDLGHPVVTVDETKRTNEFASPVAIGRASDGMLTGASDPWYHPATVVGLNG